MDIRNGKANEYIKKASRYIICILGSALTSYMWWPSSRPDSKNSRKFFVLVELAQIQLIRLHEEAWCIGTFGSFAQPDIDVIQPILSCFEIHKLLVIRETITDWVNWGTFWIAAEQWGVENTGCATTSGRFSILFHTHYFCCQYIMQPWLESHLRNGSWSTKVYFGLDWTIGSNCEQRSKVCIITDDIRCFPTNFTKVFLIAAATTG